jgi:hypothetical protein
MCLERKKDMLINETTTYLLLHPVIPQRNKAPFYKAPLLKTK